MMYFCLIRCLELRNNQAVSCILSRHTSYSEVATNNSKRNSSPKSRNLTAFPYPNAIPFYEN